MAGPSTSDHSKSPANPVRSVPPFVGRKQHLDWFEHGLRQVLDGLPRVVLIAGEVGIGKTRLLKELWPVAQRYGVQVCSGRCYEHLPLPYLPLIEALRPQMTQAQEAVERLLGADTVLLRQFLTRPEVASPPADPTVYAMSEQDQLRLFMVVTHATLALAQHCPMLLIVDDLHWADPSSLDLFEHLVFTIADTAVRESVPLLVLGTYRPEEPVERLARLLDRLQREDIYHTFTLPGLDEAEIHMLLMDLGLERPSHQLIATLKEATQGNPLFIQEVIHHLRQGGALRECGGYTVTTAAAVDLQLPKHVMGALIAHMQRLSERCRRCLTLAAFLGDHFSLRVLSTVSGASEEEVLDLLEEGLHQRLLLSEAPAFQFAHPLIRHVFYHAPSAGRRQRLHLQIAQALERLYADSLEAHILEIAHHLVMSSPVATADKVMAYARRAGDRACAMYAWGEAGRYYEAALAAAESTGCLTAQERADLHYLAGLARLWDGDVGPCREHYEKAITGYRLVGDLPGLARALMVQARTYPASVPYGTLADLQPFQELLEILGQNEPGLRSSILISMSQAYWVARQPDKAAEMAWCALEIGQSLTDDRLCALASFELGETRTQSLYVQEALEHYQQSLTYARRASDRWVEGWPLQRIPAALILLGRFDEAETVTQEAYELASQTNHWGCYSLMLAALAGVALVRGDWRTVERYGHETMVMVSRSGYPFGGALALPAVACASALRGAWVEAERALDMLVEPGYLFENPGATHKAVTQVYRQLVRGYKNVSQEEPEPLAVALQNFVRQERLDLTTLAAYCVMVDLGALGIVSIPAEQLYQVLSLATERGVLFSPGWVCLLPRILGVAATLNRWWGKAEAHFQTAIEVATRVSARPELGRTYLDYAQMLAARGARQDQLQALEKVQQASRIFHELSMLPFAHYARQFTERLQSRGFSDNLSERETAILLRIAQSRTNFLG